MRIKMQVTPTLTSHIQNFGVTISGCIYDLYLCYTKQQGYPGLSSWIYQDLFNFDSFSISETL